MRNWRKGSPTSGSAKRSTMNRTGSTLPSSMSTYHSARSWLWNSTCRWPADAAAQASESTRVSSPASSGARKIFGPRLDSGRSRHSPSETRVVGSQ